MGAGGDISGGGGGGGGKSGGDISGGGGGGVDPSAGLGGADPSFGMGSDTGGGGFSSGLDSGASPEFGQFGGGGGVDPTGGGGAQQAIAGQGQLGGQGQGSGPTDQPMPSSPVQQQNQPAQPQPSMRQPNIDIGRALMGEQHPALSGTPGGQQFASLPPSTASDASTGTPPTTAPPSATADTTNPFSGGGSTGLKLPQDTGPTPINPISSTDYTKPPTTKITPPPGPDTAPVHIDTTAQAPKPPVVSPETAGHTMLPPGTDTSGTTPPATGAGTGAGQGPFGQGMHNPFEQLIGQLMHMIFGRGMGMLEQVIGRALGINTHGLFSSLFGGGFNPPSPAPGSGYLPAGSTGGRGPVANFPATQASSFIQSRGGHSAGAGAPNLNPQFASRLASAAQAYEQETGRRAQFGEMGRSHGLQSQYYDAWKHGSGGLAAPPGSSRHEFGMATDVPRGDFNNWLHRNASKFGIEPLSRRAGQIDPYHFQMAGGRTAQAQPQGTQMPGAIRLASRDDVMNDASPELGASSQYVSPQSIANSRVVGSDTRPTPGYSTTMRDARARAFQGLDNQTKAQIAAMASLEEERDPIGPIEALFNRSASTGTPVQRLLHNGFYKTEPQFASQAAKLQSSGKLDRYMAVINDVQKGSNVLAGATDQGMEGVSNTRNPSGRIIRFGETYNDHTPASAKWRQQIQKQVQQELGGQKPDQNPPEEEKTASAQRPPRRPPGMTEAQRRILSRRKRRVASDDDMMMEA